MYRVVLALIIVCTTFNAASINAQLSPIPEPLSIVGLGSGQVTIEGSTPKAHTVLLRILNTLPGVGAILVDADNGDHLVLITATAGARLAAAALRSRPVLAASTMDIEDLEDIDMTLVAPFDAKDTGALRLTIFRNDGLTVPFMIGASPARGFQMKLKFAGSDCYPIQGFCAPAPPCPGCSTDIIECCGRPRGGCVSCPSCTISCPPCNPDGGSCNPR